MFTILRETWININNFSETCDWIPRKTKMNPILRLAQPDTSIDSKVKYTTSSRDIVTF
jgi:hypothetical protein